MCADGTGVLPYYYDWKHDGAGLVAGSFAGWTVAYRRLQWMEKHLDIHIFCNGHLLKKKKGDCPSPKVFDRYEQ